MIVDKIINKIFYTKLNVNSRVIFEACIIIQNVFKALYVFGEKCVKAKENVEKKLKVKLKEWLIF